MTESSGEARWTVCLKPNPRARLKLFCFPFAGGSSVIFHTWNRSLPGDIEVTAIELPGRRRRYKEAPLRSVSDIIHRLVPVLAPLLDRPYALFGHSMGALLAFETARALRRLGLPPPSVFMPSAATAPHLESWLGPIHALPQEAFLARLGDIGGTPPAALANDELVALALPVLRADFEALATYIYPPGPPLPCPIVAFAGQDDRAISFDGVSAWSAHSESFRLHTVPGDHFFLRSNQAQLLGLIERELADVGG